MSDPTTSSGSAIPDRHTPDKAPELAAIASAVAGLLLYGDTFKTQPGLAFQELVKILQAAGDRLDCIRAYGRWFAALADAEQSWFDHLRDCVLHDDNPFSRRVQHVPLSDLPTSLVRAARSDLQTLKGVASCPPEAISHWVQQACELPSPPAAWTVPVTTDPSQVLGEREDWSGALVRLAEHYRCHGTGAFARYRVLRWQSAPSRDRLGAHDLGGQLVGIAHPDPVRWQEIVGYEWQKQALRQNTEALLSGYRALNVLLYGSRGTGKSSLVKSLPREFGDRGLRLVEIAKADLNALPLVIEQLRSVPQVFVVFVDDLSFEEDDDAFKSLKVALEGSATAIAQNVVVYATSNRRHLIREFFADRPRPADSDEIHAWDTMQEKLSFGDRFGLTLTFEPPDQDAFLAIVRHLAQLSGILLPAEELDARAKQWATRHNGRSGRSARQFVDFLQAELEVLT
ncbi:putative ATPase (AAA+ superfamily) [Rubidibacter lacunae KORDI 51-2]|uniref:Putative ATPase (AAA+ superfamily) n=1 Tax=Rubidibacter lacunae KORDI 51-2 TaxID=582515 RepID=U5DHS7_9CHRO|nr:ATP-binding protein [Rubidibacter lacunae]ERN41196.1 putative ATPase (AAA+ superfamily) [Rubidibacter lacunae KORDI 51-2]